MNDDTIFDRILRGELPCERIYEDERALAFRDITPQAPVHILVIPKPAVSSNPDGARLDSFDALNEADDSTVAALFKAAARIARQQSLHDDGYRIVINHGRNGGQTVDYLHLHILGGRRMNWPPG